MRMDEKINQLWDYAVAHADGFTCVDIERDLGWDNRAFGGVVRRVRAVLGGDEINLVATPQGQGEPWRYSLAGNYEDAKPWTTNRLCDTETRLRTMKDVSTSIVAGTDGRTADGRKARLIGKVLTRLVEDLEDLAA